MRPARVSRPARTTIGAGLIATASPAGASPRLATVDAVRGAAVMGILLLNIIAFAMPGYAYVDPQYYGGATGANFFAWAGAYILADGKMRGLFTMLFGASMLLVADRALAGGEHPARVHYARMGWLLVIGMLHAWLVWAGDILVLYALCGAVAFLAWRLPARTLFAIAVALFAAKLAVGALQYDAAARYEAAATAPAADPALRARWQAYRDSMAPPPATAAEDLAAYRGGWASVQAARGDTARDYQQRILPLAVPDTLALLALGMALFRTGFFSGTWARRRYRQVALAGYLICIPLYLPLVVWITGTAFSPVTLLMTEALHLTLLRPLLTVADAALVILFVQSGRARWLAERLTAAGRMAFSNYIGTSLVCTLFFYGYGLGWYGWLERWQCYGVVAGVWLLILLWSKPWLDRFAYGPLEWLWRSLARGRLQRFRHN
ncbi:DUF418 domain-containing protein [Sphingomonas flavalba]|uniref:DUF418 domain-containing protein n=1 Tax=Sphingomonas flavalba TaxID=2559804 RepID=UPI0039E1E5FA